MCLNDLAALSITMQQKFKCQKWEELHEELTLFYQQYAPLATFGVKRNSNQGKYYWNWFAGTVGKNYTINMFIFIAMNFTTKQPVL